MGARNDRFHKPGKDKDLDQRDCFSRDRDRILYSRAFRRLAEVTQVVGPVEGYLFHNRLTHTLEVAQFARRLAEHLVASQSDITEEIGLDPTICEAAALAHDLGHPPFGHIGEQTLDELVRENGLNEGFEGNAQSFRIVSRLEIHREAYLGLNLTRGVLNSVLKYPWQRDTSDPAKQERSKKWRKFGYYAEDKSAFDFARANSHGEARSPEAQVMDYADAVIYSVHDLADLYQAGLIPLENLAFNDHEFAHFLEEWKSSGFSADAADAVSKEPEGWRNMLQWLSAPTQFEGNQKHRARLSTATSTLIGEFLRTVKFQMTNDEVVLVENEKFEIRRRYLQRIVWHYVINGASLKTQQEGQRRLIQLLFGIFLEICNDKSRWGLVPAHLRHHLENAGNPVRVASDVIASFSDREAVFVYHRLSGLRVGSVSDFVAH